MNPEQVPVDTNEKIRTRRMSGGALWRVALDAPKGNSTLR